MIKNRPEIFISVDIEASGPIPGEFSMLSLGACVVGDMAKSFYAELKPTSEKFVPEALAVSNFDLEKLKRNGGDPAETMAKFSDWISAVAGENSPIFVGFNATFDWAFVNWYFYTFLNKNPFGIGGIDIKAFYMGLAGVTWDQTRSSQLPPEFKSDLVHTHNALDDARSQADIFEKLLAASRCRV